MVKNLIGQILKIVRRPWFWGILVLLVLISIPYYLEGLPGTASVVDFLTNIGLTRHTLERILYLAPVLLAGLFFRWKGALIVSIIILALMVPQVVFLSPSPSNASFETGAVFIVSIAFTVMFRYLNKEKDQRLQLEDIRRNLRESVITYRQLYENAHDAIFIHNASGIIVSANKSCAALSGYSHDELISKKIDELLSEESSLLVSAVEQILIQGEASDWTTEVQLVKKNTNEASIQLSISIINNRTYSPTFICTARDVSEQKRMQENLEYYLQQATRAQEEERKRIALELHDETIQDLVVLSRQLDILATKGKELSEENSNLLKELRQQTKSIIQSLRNLSQDLRPATLDRLGLLPAIENLTSEITKYSGIDIKVSVLGQEQRLPEEVELVLFRITQEALRNVARHSKATSSEITLEFGEQKVKVNVSDDGEGFYVPEKISDLSKNGKLGLVGMQEWARLINGQLSIQSEPGKGTNVVVEAIF
jgi:PAS domain S-box-containing protein